MFYSNTPPSSHPQRRNPVLKFSRNYICRWHDLMIHCSNSTLQSWFCLLRRDLNLNLHLVVHQTRFNHRRCWHDVSPDAPQRWPNQTEFLLVRQDIPHADNISQRSSGLFQRSRDIDECLFSLVDDRRRNESSVIVNTRIIRVSLQFWGGNFGTGRLPSGSRNLNPRSNDHSSTVTNHSFKFRVRRYVLPPILSSEFSDCWTG